MGLLFYFVYVLLQIFAEMIMIVCLWCDTGATRQSRYFVRAHSLSRIKLLLIIFVFVKQLRTFQTRQAEEISNERAEGAAKYCSKQSLAILNQIINK